MNILKEDILIITRNQQIRSLFLSGKDLILASDSAITCSKNPEECKKKGGASENHFKLVEFLHDYSRIWLGSGLDSIRLNHFQKCTVCGEPFVTDTTGKSVFFGHRDGLTIVGCKKHIDELVKISTKFFGTAWTAEISRTQINSFIQTFDSETKEKHSSSVKTTSASVVPSVPFNIQEIKNREIKYVLEELNRPFFRKWSE
jgi:hypothetical protein